VRTTGQLYGTTNLAGAPVEKSAAKNATTPPVAERTWRTRGYFATGKRDEGQMRFAGAGIYHWPPNNPSYAEREDHSGIHRGSATSAVPRRSDFGPLVELARSAEAQEISQRFRERQHGTAPTFS
jgi:hypothetical protein